MTPRRPRLAVLDALRGFAVLAMIHQHVSIWLWRGPDAGYSYADYPGLVALNVAVVIGAPLFFALSGMGAGMLARDPARPGLDVQLVRRGVVLIAFGLVVNLATPSWFSWGSFFALHLMGLSWALTPLFRRLCTPGLLALALGIFAITPFVQAWLGLPAELTNPEMRDVTQPGGVLRLALAASQYPMLPWSGVFVLGLWAARLAERRRLAPLVGVGATLIALAALGHAAQLVTAAEEPSVLWRAFHFKLGWFPAPLLIVMALTGPVLWILAAAVRREDHHPVASTSPLVSLGRASLTVFIVHAPLFRELSRTLGLWSALDPATTLAVVVGFTVVCLLGAHLWAKVDFRWSAEWWLRKLADAPLRATSDRASPRSQA